jgi:TrmH family RNA methyltransferase
MIVSRENERLKLVRKLHEKRWRDKLGLFFVEGEDAVEAATAEPFDVLRAGEDVEPRLLAEVGTAAHAPRVIAVYRRADLPAWGERDATLALWRLADPGNVGTLIRTADAFGAAVALSDGWLGRGRRNEDRARSARRPPARSARPLRTGHIPARGGAGGTAA